MAESRLALFASIAANVGIAATKFVAAAITGSSGMLAEGMHSMVDTADGLLLLLGRHRAALPADEEHPFGHGHALYFWALIVAIIFFAVGGGMSVYEGIERVLHPEPIENVLWSYATLAAAALFDGTSFVIGARNFRAHTRHMKVGPIEAMRRSKDPSLFSVVLEDSADLIGLTFAFVGIFLSEHFGLHRADGFASIGIGFVLMGVAVFLATQTRGLLIGERASRPTVSTIRDAAQATPGVARVEALRTMQLGPHAVLAMLRVRVAADQSPARLPHILHDVEQRVRDACDEVHWITVGLAQDEAA